MVGHLLSTTCKNSEISFWRCFAQVGTAVDNPIMLPSGMAQRRSFLVLEEGDIDGTTGYWTEDEDDGAEGFLEALEDVSWFLMPLKTHGINEGSKEGKPDEAKAKEREKEKKKAEEDEDTSSQEDPKAEEKEEEKAALTWWEKKDMKKTGKKKKIGMISGMKAIGPMNKTGMMAFGPQTNGTTKEKERKERKARRARMMKEKANQEMEKASQTMFSHKLHGILPFKSNNNRLIIYCCLKFRAWFCFFC